MPQVSFIKYFIILTILVFFTACKENSEVRQEVNQEVSQEEAIPGKTVQEQNIDYLISIGEDERVIPHRINTIGSLNDIQADGYNSFEIDIFYENGEIIVGHSTGEKTGLTLDQLFDAFENKDLLGKVWLDFKYLSEDDYVNVKTQLNLLDDKYGIKEKAILESGTQSSFFNQFVGWHRSYYLPTWYTLDLLDKNDHIGLTSLASEIANQAIDQKLSAVSFDSRLYPFVKNYLESKLNSNIVYHTWTYLFLNSNDFQTNLESQDYFNDSRIKTIIVEYDSLYDE